jgi:hypothetical protein
MAAAKCSITVKVSFAWWVFPYLHALTAFAFITGCTPDIEKVHRIIQRGMKLQVQDLPRE